MWQAERDCDVCDVCDVCAHTDIVIDAVSVEHCDVKVPQAYR